MKKKLKKQIERQKLQQEEIEQGRLVEKDDENEDGFINHDCNESTPSCEKNSNEHCKDKLEQNCDQKIDNELKITNSENMEMNCDEDAFCDEVGSKLLQEQCVVSEDETRRPESKQCDQEIAQGKLVSLERV